MIVDRSNGQETTDEKKTYLYIRKQSIDLIRLDAARRRDERERENEWNFLFSSSSHTIARAPMDNVRLCNQLPY